MFQGNTADDDDDDNDFYHLMACLSLIRNEIEAPLHCIADKIDS